MLRDLYDPTYQRLSGAFGTPAFWHGTLVASALVGTIIGSLVFYKPADRYGRRPMLMLMGVLYLISSIGSAIAWMLDRLHFSA